MLQQDQPDDYVLATGETHSVREFIELAFAEIGRTIEWRGEGVDEEGVDAASGEVLVEGRSALFPSHRSRSAARRPDQGQTRLGWKHETGFPQLCEEDGAAI